MALGFYFERWRYHAISFLYVIVAFGMFTSAPIGLFIIGSYGIRSAFFIMAGANAQICVVGMLCKPSSIERRVQKERLLSLERDNQAQLSICTRTIRLFFNITLLKNIPFLCFLISTSSWNFGLTVAIMHLPNYIATNSGSIEEIGWIMTSFSIGHILGRALGVLGVSKGEKCSLFLHIGSIGIGGALSVAFPLYARQTVGKFIFSVLFGLSCGPPSSMGTVLSTMFVGLAMLPEAYSLCYFFGGIGVIAGPVVAGR